MKPIDAFLDLFGDITILNVVEFVLACLFIYYVYKKFEKHSVDKHAKEEEKDQQLKEALDATRKYPEYRQQSIKIQHSLEDSITEVKNSQKKSDERLVQIEEQLKEMKERSERRDRNKLRDLLLQNYRYYTNPEKNPSRSWTRMEAEAFWELFKDYEDAGGNGYMHTEVQPAMERLIIIDVGLHTNGE